MTHTATEPARHEGQHPLVVVVDLRTGYDDVMAAGRFSDIQTRYARTRIPSGTTRVNVDRVLVIDDTALLVEHRPAYERIVSGLYSRIVCVAVGPPVDGTVVLRRPGQLVGSDAAIIWVGDPRGVEWGPGRGPGLVVGADDAGETGETGEDGTAEPLAPLLDVLTQPEVFDQVLAGVTEMPRSVAAPGLSLYVHRLRDDAVLRARLRAATRLGGTDGGADVPWPAPLDALTDGTGEAMSAISGGVRECVRSDGRIGAMWHTAEQRLHGLRGRVGRLTRPVAPYRFSGDADPGRGPSIAGEVRGVAEVLTDYRNTLRDTVGRGTGGTGFDPDTRAWLDHVGVTVPDPPGLGAAPVTTALRERVVTGFNRPEGLRGLAERLRELAARMTPRAGEGRIQAVERALPEALLDRLRRPAPFPVGPAYLPVMLAVCAAGLLTGLWSATVLIGVPLAVVLAVAGAALVVLRRPDREGGPAFPAHAAPALVVGGAVALVGAGLGALAGSAWDPPAWVGVPALILGLAALCAIPGWDWTLRARQWEYDLGLTPALGALHALHTVLVGTVWHDWALAAPRREAVDRATVLAALLEDTAAVLTEEAGDLQRRIPRDVPAPAGSPEMFTTAPGGAGGPSGYAGAAGPPPGGFGAAGAAGTGGGLYEQVAEDLADLLRAAFEPLWAMLERDPAEASRHGAARALRPLLTGYDDHLAHNGVQAAPPFARRRQDRPHIGDASGGDAVRIAEAVGPPADRPMLQLCAPDELVLLDSSSESARCVRFAPRGVRPAVREALRDRRAGDLVDSEIVWTGGGRLAGAVRLLPLLPGSVDDARIWDEEHSAPGERSRSDRGDGAP